MLRFFEIIRIQLTLPHVQKLHLWNSYSAIKIVPKKNPSGTVVKYCKPYIGDYKLSKITPKFVVKYVPPAAILKEISHIRLFHTSDSRKAAPALIVIVLRPLVKLAAVLFGRTLRKWWQALPPERKQAILIKLQKYGVHITGFCTVMTLTGVHYYFSHLQQDPFTKRWRFVIFTREQMVQIADLELEILIEQYRDLFLHPNDREFRKVTTIANRILNANQDVPGLQNSHWRVTVVDHPSLRNAFVLANGTIFIFTGMIELCDNDDQLGVILAHEISHALLGHVAEQMSNVQLIEWLLIIPVVIFWALMPDGAALLSQWLSGQFANLMFHLPFSRYLETEADQVGLVLAAKACFDVREASIFWKKMSELDKANDDDGRAEWLSTHPNHDTREHVFESMMPQILQLREKCNCPQLPSYHPRTRWKPKTKKNVPTKKEPVKEE